MRLWLPLLLAIVPIVSGYTGGICENDTPYINTQCSFWAKRGDCSNPTVARECKKACSQCEGQRDCVNDVDEICTSVASQGQCSNNVVRQHCSKACNSCGEKKDSNTARPSRQRRPDRKQRQRKPQPTRPDRKRPNRNRKPKTTEAAPTEYPRGPDGPADLRSKLGYNLRTCFSEFAKPGDHCEKTEKLFFCAYNVIYGPKAVPGINRQMRTEYIDDFKSVFVQFGLNACGFTYDELKRKFESMTNTDGGNDNCEELPVDIMYVIDTSSSINSKNPMAYMQALDFSASLLDHFNFKDGNTRVAAIQFANGIFPYHAIDFDEYHTKETIQQAIRDLIYLPALYGNWMAGSYSHIWKGLDYMRDEFLPMCRPEATKTTIVLTDGLSNPGNGKTVMAAKKAKEAGVKLIAVGIGTAHSKPELQRELEDIAGSRSNVFRVSDYSVQPRISQVVKETKCDQSEPRRAGQLRHKIRYDRGPPKFN